MHWNFWNLRRLAMLCSIVLAAMLSLTSLDGCSKSSSSSTSSDSSSDGSGDSANADSSSGSNEDDNEPIDPSVFEQVRSMMQLQVDSVATQVETYRQAEKEHPDAQLKSLVDQMEAKVTEAKKLMEKATSPAQSHMLKVEVPKLVGEAGELSGKATGRLMEILQAGVPKPVTPSGGGGA